MNIKIKVMKKTFNNGILIGTVATSIVYSIIMFFIIQELVK